ncbi:MAG: LytTR family transcriptional regulator DNA-binding domain-containing protein [Lachnospiraceae bacterium]|nr:LytTR family transcriptional regulator DNA-binding domain-containing protein [Lachnospiraceae bacterium]
MININIHVIEDSKEETIDIFCHEEHKEKMQKIACEFADGSQKITCKKDDKTYRIRLDDIFYIETVDEHLFIYCENDVYENRMRLYEAEQLCEDTLFFKASKSMLINIKKIENMKPSLSGRFEITMINGEKLLVSRKYVADLKEKMGL